MQPHPCVMLLPSKAGASVEEVLACDTSCFWVCGAPLSVGRHRREYSVACCRGGDLPKFAFLFASCCTLASKQAPRNEVATVSCLLENMAARHSAPVLRCMHVPAKSF